MITIDEIMTPNPVCLKLTDTLGDAHDLMENKHIHHIPIIDDQSRLLGLVTHRDVLAASGSVLRANPSDKSDTPLAQIMVEDVVAASPSSSTLKAAQYIHGSRNGCLPIVDDEKVVGIVTEYDFVEVAMNLLERRKAKDYASDEIETFDDPNDDISSLDIDTSSARDWD